MSRMAMPAPCHLIRRRPRGSAIARIPHTPATSPPLTAWRNAPVTTDALGVTNQSFFNPAQAHVGESAQCDLAATNMPSPNAMGSSCGTALPVQPERMSKEGWSQQTAFPSVSTGKSQKDAQPQATQTGTGAPDAESQGTELKHALEQRRLEPLSPYRREAWTAELSHLGLLCKYPSVIQGFANGFNLGIPPIRSTYAPENHHSIQHLLMAYNDIVEHEFAGAKKRWVIGVIWLIHAGQV